MNDRSINIINDDASQSRPCFTLLKQHFGVLRDALLCGEYGDAYDRTCFSSFFVEICSILRLLGDVYGYIVVYSDGVVDPVSSYAPFLERFVQCMELMHVCLISHGDVDGGPETKIPKSVMSRLRAFRPRVARVVHPILSVEGLLIPMGVHEKSNYRLRVLFARSAQLVMDLFQISLPKRYYRVSPRFDGNVMFYVNSRRAEQVLFGSKSGLARMPRYQDESLVLIKLKASFVHLCACIGDKWELYFALNNIEGCDSSYNGLKLRLRMEIKM